MDSDETGDPSAIQVRPGGGGGSGSITGCSGGNIPFATEVEEVQRKLAADSERLELLIDLLTPPGDADPEMRSAAIDLRQALVRTHAHLSQLENRVEQAHKVILALTQDEGVAPLR